MCNLGKSAEQKKINDQLKLKKVLKRTHGKKIAETFSPITNELKKVDKCTKKLGEVFERTNSENEKKNKR